jgi:ketosteroid isomerase-like protein
MPPRTIPEIARACYGAYVSKDRRVIEPLLSEDFRFTSPYDDHIDRATYFIRCWANADRIRAIEIEQIAEVGDAAFVLYTCETTAGARFRNTEYLRFRDGRITAVEVFFGDLPRPSTEEAGQAT